MALTRLSALFLLATLISCQPETGKPAGSGRNPFFDLRGYFEGEIKRLERQQPAVEKILAVNDKSETLYLDSLSYRDELQPFLASDINRPSWWDKYTCDSTYAGAALSAIRYQARDSSLRIRDLQVNWQNGQVRRISIRRFTDSFTAAIAQQLDYQPGKGYQVSTRQEVVLSKPKEIEVKVTFR